MLKKLTNNLGLKLLSLLVAVVLWLVVVNIDDPVTTRTFNGIHVDIENEETITSEGKVYSILDGSDSVNVTVKAKRSVLDSLVASDIKAYANMREMDVSLGLVPIDVYSLRNANKIEEVSTRTKNLKISMEDLLTKQFAIVNIISGTPAEGYAVGDITINPNVVKVSGPASLVEKVARAVVRIDVAGMGTKLNLKLIPLLLDSTGDVISTTGLSLNIKEVDAEVNMINTKEVPIVINTVGAPASGYTHTKTEFNPQKIKVKGSSEALDALTEIKLPDELLDISGAKETLEKTVDITEYLPKSVEPVDSNDKNIVLSAVIEHLDKRSITVSTSAIEKVNLTMGLQAAFVSDKVNIEVEGLSETIKELEADDLTCEVDLSDCTKVGKFSVPLKVTTPSGVTANEGIKVEVNITQGD